MAIDSEKLQWLQRFTGGAVAVPQGPVREGEDDPQHDQALQLQLRLEFLQAREWAEEQALKTVLLAKAFKVIDQHKETMRKQFDLQVTLYKDADAEEFDVLDEGGQPTGKKEKKSATKELNVRDKEGRQERAYDAMESTRVKSVKGGSDGKLTATDATQAMAVLVEQKDQLASQKTRRSSLDKKTKAIVQKEDSLFSDPELMNELYTPLVRDLVLPETFVPAKYSATQKMIDGSDDYYVKECKAKGKPIPTGAAALAKGAIALGSAVATTVIGGLGEVKSGQQAMATSGALGKQMAARAGDITMGIAATLTGVVDAVDQIDDLRKSGDFSTAGYQTVLNGLALGIGKIVAGSTGDYGLGLVITDTITGFATLTAMAGEIKTWKDKGGEFPLDRMFSLVGGGIASGLSAASDKTSDTDDNGKMSTRFAQASQGVTTLFESAARAQKAKLLEKIKAGDWGAVFSFLGETANEVGKQLPAQIYLDEKYNQQTDYDKQKQQGDALSSPKKTDVANQLESGGKGALKLLGEGGKALGGKVDGPQTPQQKRMAEIERAFAAKKDELAQAAEKAAEGEVSSIVEQMAKEKEAFQKSLLCLGSTEPDDAGFKSIASLVAQLERDRAIWDGLTALFGGGIGAASGMAAAMSVAAEVAAPLKAAGQLLKYCINLKAAADRCEAWLKWREGQKDAQSAVSPYATSIDNFTKTQGQQFTHYSIQAAANAIQALLACGEMSPLAPAFKAAGGAVAATAAAEDLIYQFYKRAALRRAWSMTKQALDPKNKGNRKMALLARQVNPTLAKYTLAYGALVEESPVAITACNRIGIDRETLARSSDKVSDLKDYLEKLYPDDGVVVGVLDVTPGKTPLPATALSTKAWALSILIWTNEHNLGNGKPPGIVGHLANVERLLAKQESKTPLGDDELDLLLRALNALQMGFAAFEPRTAEGEPLQAIKKAVADYADLAEVKAMTLQMQANAAADAPG